MDKRMEIEDNTMVMVYNEFGGVVTYETRNIARIFQAGSKREVSFSELKELIVQDGYSAGFEKGYLMIRDNRVRELLGLSLLDKYNLDESQIKDLLLNKPEFELEEFLQYTSDHNLEKTLRVAVELPIKDLNRANLLYAYSGKNVLNMIQEKEEEAIVETGVRQRIDGKAPANPTTPARGKIVPKN